MSLDDYLEKTNFPEITCRSCGHVMDGVPEEDMAGMSCERCTSTNLVGAVEVRMCQECGDRPALRDDDSCVRCIGSARPRKRRQKQNAQSTW
ncbi:MAG: hypothetical protein Q8R30_03775 [bacterium]|nr:hypothetical protein [bacterium]MDZ4285787.1 hypothetical protein [Candidatus Sungbacteria bacterium]